MPRRKSDFYRLYPSRECYDAAWSSSDDAPKTRRLEGRVIGTIRSGDVVLEVTEFGRFNGLWHLPHNKVYRVEKFVAPKSA